MIRGDVIGRVLWLLSLTAMIGCVQAVGDDDDSGSAGDDDDTHGDDDTTEPPNIEEASGVLDVAEMYNQGGSGLSWSSQIRGQLNDGPDPTFHRVTMEQGECAYLELHQALCDPPCGGDQVCDAFGECQTYPGGLTAGTLTVTGVGDPIVIEPQEWYPGLYYGPFGLPGDLFETGATLTAAFTGDQLPPLTLQALGVAPMDTTLADEDFVIVPGQDNVFTWTPGPDPGARVEIVINATNIAHGAPLTDIIHCTGPDDGELTLPQDLVDAFPVDQIPESCIHFDCPPSELTRHTTSAAEVDGQTILLIVRSTVYFMGGDQIG